MLLKGKSAEKSLYSNGTNAQPIKAKKNVRADEKRNIIGLALVGKRSSLTINLTPSVIGCNIPHIPTTFGPLLRCIDAIILRSANVKKAIAISKGITVNKAIKISVHGILYIISINLLFNSLIKFVVIIS
jgi:hypothetical protein